METKVDGHALVVTFPAQGLINPMLQFAKRLVSNGLKATLVTTISISKIMHLSSALGSVQLDVISDGFDDDPLAHVYRGEAYVTSLRVVGSKTLAELVTKYENSSNPVNCIIYASFMPWPLDVAKQFGLVAASFFTQPCSVDYIYYNAHRGLLSIPISSTPVALAGLPLLELQDMPSLIAKPESFPAKLEMVISQFSNDPDYVLINTFYKLEDEVLDAMSKNCPLLTIGPTVPSFYLDKRVENDENYGLDLFALNESNSSNWLNTKPAGSVVYVAFGSIIELSDKQMEELALGLKRSNFHFLWVMKASEEAKLPKKFSEEVADKGLIVNWNSQMKLLSHEAVGCFLTHCGWNSTLEALSLGVPMVAMPRWADEPTIAKFVEDVWKVGIRVKVDQMGIVKREEIEFCIKEVMEGGRGRELKDNARKWRELAVEAVSEGGTSDRNILGFVSELISSTPQAV